MIANTPTPDAVLKTHVPNYDHGAAAGGDWMRSTREYPFYLFFHVPQMMRQERVNMCMRYIKGSVLSLARFYVQEPESDDELGEDGYSEVKQFIVNQLTRWWRTSAMKMMSAIEWGYSGCEVMYAWKNNMVQFDSVRKFHQRDIRPVTKDNALVGMIVEANTGHDGGGGSVYLGGPKALWHIHDRDVHPYFGRSRCFGAFDPWLELTSRNGAIDSRRLYFYKCAFQGDTMFYEPASDLQNGVMVDNRDTARELIDKRRNGANIALPSVYDQNGNRLWEIEYGQAGAGSQQLLDYPDKLKDEISEGIGVPAEMIEAAETGSGFSGRRIPQSAFRGTLSDLVFWLVADFDQQVLCPLLRMNYGIVEPTHEIIPFGMVRDQDEDTNVNEDEEQMGGQAQQRENSVPNSRRQAAKFSLVV